MFLRLLFWMCVYICIHTSTCVSFLLFVYVLDTLRMHVVWKWYVYMSITGLSICSSWCCHTIHSVISYTYYDLKCLHMYLHELNVYSRMHMTHTHTHTRSVWSSWCHYILLALRPSVRSFSTRQAMLPWISSSTWRVCMHAWIYDCKCILRVRTWREFLDMEGMYACMNLWL